MSYHPLELIDSAFQFTNQRFKFDVCQDISGATGMIKIAQMHIGNKMVMEMLDTLPAFNAFPHHKSEILISEKTEKARTLPG